jgi:hypothetical protein
MSDDSDAVAIGRMLSKLDHLSDLLQRAERRMETTEAHMKLLSERLGEIEDRYKVGKAAAFGAVMVLAAAVYGVKDLFGRLLGSMAP